MFTTVREPFGKFTKVTLLDSDTGESVSFVPEFGGNILELVLSKNGKTYSVIEGFQSYEELIQNSFMKSGRLIPFPNRILNGTYTFDGTTFQLPVNEKARNNAIHGFFYNRNLAEKGVTVDQNQASIQLEYDYSGDYPGYPFAFKVQLIYILMNSHEFKITSRIKNTDTRPLPLGEGWHPYFRFGKKVDELFLKIPSTETLVLSNQMVPTGEILQNETFSKLTQIGDQQLDTVFRLKAEEGVSFAELVDKRENAILRAWQETGPRKYNFMVVFIPPDRQSIAIEPMTCATNAFNNHDGLIILEPGEVFEANHGVKLV